MFSLCRLWSGLVKAALLFTFMKDKEQSTNLKLKSLLGKLQFTSTASCRQNIVCPNFLNQINCSSDLQRNGYPRVITEHQHRQIHRSNRSDLQVRQPEPSLGHVSGKSVATNSSA